MTGSTDTTPATPADTTPPAAAEPPMNLDPAALPAVDEGLLAAVKASVAGEPAPKPPEPAAEAPKPAETAPEGGEKPAETPKNGEKPAETAKEAAAKPVEAPKPAEEAKPAAKPSDAFGELPQDAKTETKERFGKLKGAFDEQAARLAAIEATAREATEQRDQWRQAVLDTGADPEQFGMTLAFLKDLNSGTKDGLERAYTALTGQLAEMAKALGRDVPGVFDPLAEHKDLQARLADHEDPLTREDALQIAHARNRAAALEQGQRTQAARTQETHQQQTFEQQQSAALAAIQAFGADKRANDPLYEAKMAAIAPAVKRVVANLPPAKWASEVAAIYAETVVAAPPPRPPVQKVPDPLRPTASPAGAGGTVKAPGSAIEAARMAIGLGG